MKIKICGLMHKDNLLEVENLQPDYFGFIFYPKSERYIRSTLAPSDLMKVPGKKVGVFVNSPEEEIIKAAKEFHLNAIQLHGDESPQYCENLKNKNLEVIKAFRVDKDFDFSMTKEFRSCCNFYLFDTKGKKEGGNGFSFDWQLLNNYDQEVPFFLSGGIGPENVMEINTLRNMNLYGIDLNSRVEISAGIKDIKKIKETMDLLKDLNKEKR